MHSDHRRLSAGKPGTQLTWLSELNDVVVGVRVDNADVVVEQQLCVHSGAGSGGAARVCVATAVIVVVASIRPIRCLCDRTVAESVLELVVLNVETRPIT